MRPFRDEDAPALIAIHRDETLRRFTRTPVTDPAEAARWLDLQRRGWAEGHRYSFAVLERRDGRDDGRAEGSDDARVDDRADAPAELVANVVLKRAEPGGPAAEVGYWTAAAARGRGVAPRALEVLTGWAFAAFAADGLVRLDLLHQVDNTASCRVAEKTGYGFRSVLPALPPEFPLDGHLHSRSA
ncbi:GNAT family N-acetyltransferase [Kitasatospora sp. A2-31]|nr:GNAT family N-acetyltransferase [Kitasatospora sp. A2-31]MCG6500307.1 GNAT family N-acetyltransferase [Kitasatospora sp. A2-31]